MDGAPGGEEVVLLDENVTAGEAEFFSLGTFNIDPTGRWLAYSTDTDGSEVFETRIRDLDTLTDLDDVITETHYSSAWSRDGSVLFYTRQDATKRPYQGLATHRREPGRTTSSSTRRTTSASSSGSAPARPTTTWCCR